MVDRNSQPGLQKERNLGNIVLGLPSIFLIFFFIVIVVFETEYHYTVQVGLELTM